MKHIKKFNEDIESVAPSDPNYYEDKSIKDRLTEYYYEREADYGEEEVKNVIEILDEYDDNLTGLSRTDKTLLLRLVDDHELYEEVDEINRESISHDRDNLFD